MQRLQDLTSAYRVVTLTGPGGIGKTVLASETARRLFPVAEKDVFFVELVSLADPQLVSSRVATTLGLQIVGDEISAASVARVIGTRKLLLVLDNCEHLVDAVARTIEALLQSCPHATVLATSREVLRIDGEFVYQVAPLELPSQHQDPDGVLESSSVQLFVARISALESGVKAQERDLSAIAMIVRRLDGIPLAIEFAAARAATLGIQEVAARLDDRFALLIGGRRTALPRHQTLRAALDWSYELLPSFEQLLLRSLGSFAGGFTLDGALAVMADADQGPSSIVNGVANLVEKSLIVRDGESSLGRMRLLETTRAYAIEKLSERGDARRVAQRHAEFYRSTFARFVSDRKSESHFKNIELYKAEIDNLRSALNWAFSPSGNPSLGVELAASATDFWDAIFLVAEARDWASNALAQIGDAAGTHIEMVLQSSLGWSLVYTRGMTSAAKSALTRALELAQSINDIEHEQRATLGLWHFLARSADSNGALALAREYEIRVRGRGKKPEAVADWIVGISLTYMAEHREAADRLQRAIEFYPTEHRILDLASHGADLRASASAHLTVNLLSLGNLDAASQTAVFSIEEARSAGHTSTLCISLAWAAGFVYLSLDELDAAERFGSELIECASKNSLRPFYAAGLCVRGSLAAKRGDPKAGIGLLRDGLAEMKIANYFLFYPFYTAELAKALGAIQNFDEAHFELEAALRMALDIGYQWFVPELLRVKGELLALQEGHDPVEIESLFRRAIAMAEEQYALYWQLCSAVSYAKLLSDLHRNDDARLILKPVFDRLREGMEMPRVGTAKHLLDRLF